MPVRMPSVLAVCFCWPCTQRVAQLISLQRKGVNEVLDALLAFSHRSPNSGILDSIRARQFMEPDMLLDTLP
jgi:hypothetical protein